MASSFEFPSLNNSNNGINTSGSGGNKYAVFPLDRLLQQQQPQIQQVQSQIATTVSSDLGNLDREIQEIIFDPNHIYPNDGIKYKALRELVVKFVQLNREFREPVKIAIETGISDEDMKAGEEKLQRFPNLERISNELETTSGPIYKNRALSFLKRLDRKSVV